MDDDNEGTTTHGQYAAKAIEGSSNESIQGAVQEALTNNPRTSSFRSLTLESITVEEGGFVGGTIYRVALNPQPLPLSPTES
jgi:hypothetical protein